MDSASGVSVYGRAVREPFPAGSGDKFQKSKALGLVPCREAGQAVSMVTKRHTGLLLVGLGGGEGGHHKAREPWTASAIGFDSAPAQPFPPNPSETRDPRLASLASAPSRSFPKPNLEEEERKEGELSTHLPMTWKPLCSPPE